MFLISNRLSEHRAETPEGYLLCTGCVIAATGAFPYKPSEVAGVAPGPDGLIHIRREPEDLFSPEAMASFEGKPVVFGHEHFADPENWGKIAKGIVQNVRRGSGEDFDKLIADLLITDSEAIAAVKSGDLEELSCGYDATVEDLGGGNARHSGFVGNHVALVKRARLGRACRIGDSQPMLSFKNTIRKLFKDGDEDGLNDYLDQVNASSTEAPQKAADETPAQPAAGESAAATPDPNAALLTRIDALEKAVARLASLVAPKATEGSQEDTDEAPEGGDLIEPEQAKQVLQDAETVAPDLEKPACDSQDGRLSRSVLERLARAALKRDSRFGDSDSMASAALFSTLHAAAVLRKEENNPKPLNRSRDSMNPEAEVNSVDYVNGINSGYWATK